VCPAWAHSWRRKSSCELATANEVKRNCERATAPSLSVVRFDELLPHNWTPEIIGKV